MLLIALAAISFGAADAAADTFPKQKSGALEQKLKQSGVARERRPDSPNEAAAH
jgi:hypothetical protein